MSSSVNQGAKEPFSVYIVPKSIKEKIRSESFGYFVILKEKPSFSLARNWISE